MAGIDTFLECCYILMKNNFALERWKFSFLEFYEAKCFFKKTIEVKNAKQRARKIFEEIRFFPGGYNS